MKVKELFKKAAVVTMSLAVALSSAAFIPTESSIVKAASAVTARNETCYLENFGSEGVDIVKYTLDANDLVNEGRFDIVVTKDNAYPSEITVSNIEGIQNGQTGVYEAHHYKTGDSIPTYQKSITTKSVGVYRVYYRNKNVEGDSVRLLGTCDVRNDNSSSSSTTSSGPQISTRSMKKYGYGVDFIFRVTNETCDYEWHIYDRVPSSSNKSELDSGSGYTSDKNDDIYISTNNLNKNTTYYLWLKVTGDNTKRTNYYSDNGTSSNTNSYYTIRTVNSDTWASGTSGTSSASSSSTKRNSDGTTTSTTNATENGVRIKTEKTTGYSDGHEYTLTTSTPTSSSADWKSSESKYTKYSDGSSEQTMTTLMKDGSKVIAEAKTTSLGTTTMVTGNYSNTNAITALKTEILNSSNIEVLELDYTLGSGSNIAVKKITGTKTSVTVPDSVTSNGNEYTVTSVADNAFKNNSKVTKLVLGDSITKVGKNAFKNNKKLKTVVINNPLSSVGTNAFKGINKNATIKIDAGASAYKKTVKRIQKAGVASTVKFKNI